MRRRQLRSLAGHEPHEADAEQSGGQGIVGDGLAEIGREMLPAILGVAQQFIDDLPGRQAFADLTDAALDLLALLFDFAFELGGIL